MASKIAVDHAAPVVDELFDRHYEELRAFAHSIASRRTVPPGHHTTSLLHDAYLRVVNTQPRRARDDAHLTAIIVRAIRFAFIDRLRKRARSRAADRAAATTPSDDVDHDEFLALDEALHRLAQLDPRKASVVEMRFFGGFDVPETAHALGIAEPTVKRDFAFARAWLARELRAPNEPAT